MLIRRVPFVALVVVSLAAAAPTSARAACWHPPVVAPVVDPYRAPACPWCPGNRGIEYATAPGTPVRAVAAGHVTFAGSVVQTRYVVVEHSDGRRTTYGDLASVTVARGDVVVARSVVGRASSRVHFGLREGRRYLDPTPHLGRLTYPTRLIPHDGWQPRSAGPPRLACDI